MAGLFVRIGRYLLVKACKNAEKRELLSARYRCICATRSQNRREPRHFPLLSGPPFGDVTPWFNPLTLGAPMKKLLLTSVASVALIAAGSANAADLRAPVYKGPPPVVAPAPPPFSWTGCFVGAHWGWGWGEKNVNETFDETDTRVSDGAVVFTDHEAASGKLDTSGGIFGGQVGCDYQFGWGKGKGAGGPGGLNWVIGIQFDAAGTDINDQITDPFAAHFDDPFARIAVKQDWLASLTGRLGITGFGGGFWSQTLWYVRGGVAWTRDRWDLTGVNEDLAIFHVFSPVNQNRTGWTIGVGWEWAFLPNWSAFVEWNHYDFGTKTLLTQHDNFNFDDGLFNADFASRINTNQRLETVKIGVNYRFNLFGKAPGVVARY